MASNDTPTPSRPAQQHPNHNDDADLVDDDPFDPAGAAQNLESTYYAEGYALGRSDGARAGRIEGRVFGLEKGYDKFFAMGRLGGRAAVWGARLDMGAAAAAPSSSSTTTTEGREAQGGGGSGVGPLGPLRQHPRLAGHVTTLHALAEAASLETRNTEDGVADFDDRFRRAEAKAKVIERVVGEPLDEDQDEDEAAAAAGGEGPGDQKHDEPETDAETKEDFAVEVTMDHVEARLRKEREKQKENEVTPSGTTNSSSTKKPPPPSRAPKRAGVKVASGGSRARAGEKNMEDFGIGEARALGRLL